MTTARDRPGDQAATPNRPSRPTAWWVEVLGSARDHRADRPDRLRCRPVLASCWQLRPWGYARARSIRGRGREVLQLRPRRVALRRLQGDPRAAARARRGTAARGCHRGDRLGVARQHCRAGASAPRRRSGPAGGNSARVNPPGPPPVPGSSTPRRPRWRWPPSRCQVRSCRATARWLTPWKPYRHRRRQAATGVAGTTMIAGRHNHWRPARPRQLITEPRRGRSLARSGDTMSSTAATHFVAPSPKSQPSSSPTVTPPSLPGASINAGSKRARAGEDYSGAAELTQAAPTVAADDCKRRSASILTKEVIRHITDTVST